MLPTLAYCIGEILLHPPITPPVEGGGVVMKKECSVIVRWRDFIPFKFCYL